MDFTVEKHDAVIKILSALHVKILSVRLPTCESNDFVDCIVPRRVGEFIGGRQSSKDLT